MRLGWTLAGAYMVLLACVILVAGCAGKVAPPVMGPPTEVKVLVRQPCTKRADIPSAPPHVASQLNGQAAHDLLIVDQSALELRTWGESLAAMLTACAD